MLLLLINLESCFPNIETETETKTFTLNNTLKTCRVDWFRTVLIRYLHCVDEGTNKQSINQPHTHAHPKRSEQEEGHAMKCKVM